MNKKIAHRTRVWPYPCKSFADSLLGDAVVGKISKSKVAKGLVDGIANGCGILRPAAVKRPKVDHGDAHVWWGIGHV